jgi:hypothetical protein
MVEGGDEDAGPETAWVGAASPAAIWLEVACPELAWPDAPEGPWPESFWVDVIEAVGRCGVMFE